MNRINYSNPIFFPSFFINSWSNNRRLISIQIFRVRNGFSISSTRGKILNNRKTGGYEFLKKMSCPSPVGRELPFLDSRHDRGTIYDASVPPCFEKGGTLLLRAATTGDSPFSEVRWTEYISRPRDLSRTNKFLARNADNVFPLLERRWRGNEEMIDVEGQF